MIPFLKKVAQDLVNEKDRFNKIGIIMPSRRAAVFLKKEISQLIKEPVFSPFISTTEDFLMETLGWEQENNPNLIFKLYKAYLKLELEEIDNFKEFSRWAQTLLADFNEIDRYLVSPKELFNYIADVKRIESWDLNPGEDGRTKMVNDYLKFWEKLPEFYENYQKILLEDKRVYQGLAYREFAQNFDQYLKPIQEQFESLYFVGFSALNTAEEKILLSLYENGLAHFFWDIDEFYYNDPVHEAGKFLRESQLIQKLKERDDFHGVENLLSTESKSILIKAVAGDTLQAISANSTVLEYQEDELEDVAVVMADENLLTPFLNNLADDIPTLNITMGLPMRFAPIGGFFDLLWSMQISQEINSRVDEEGNAAFHFQKWDDLLAHPIFKKIESTPGSIEAARTEIRKQNQIFFSYQNLKSWSGLDIQVGMQEIFSTKAFEPASFCQSLAHFCEELKNLYSESISQLGILFSFFKLFEQLQQLFESHDFAIDLKTAQQFYKELLQTETIDLQGEPLSGLQVMGMLETRTLDFRNVIITSVNEDVLPKGRSQNSLIPFDIKHKFGLPTYLDKDGVFAYHFFRLLQRAENITLIYNSQNKGLGGGEASRFINQLEYELQKLNPNISLERKSISGNVQIEDPNAIIIEKTPSIMARLKTLAEKGISPSALIDYINNPLKFYYKRVLGIKENDEVEEVIAYNTQGTVLHEILQEYYSKDNKPIGELKADDDIFSKKEEELRNKVIEGLKKHGLKNSGHGKNLLIRETLVGMLRNFLQQEKKELSNNGLVKLIALEDQLESVIQVNQDLKVKLKGVVDRIDNSNGETRIIDYKTGGVLPAELKFKDWQDLAQPEFKNKAFQLMMYTLLYMDRHPDLNEASPAIISLRNVSQWPMRLTYNRKETISRENLTDFRKILTSILTEIFDSQTPFQEKILSLRDHDQ